MLAAHGAAKDVELHKLAEEVGHLLVKLHDANQQREELERRLGNWTEANGKVPQGCRGQRPRSGSPSGGDGEAAEKLLALQQRAAVMYCALAAGNACTCAL